MPAPGSFPECQSSPRNTGRSRRKRRRRRKRKGYASSSRWKSWMILRVSQMQDERKLNEREKKVGEEDEGRRARRRVARKRSKKIRAGTEKKKKVKVQRGRKQPVQVQVFYYARLSRLWHSCFEEPGNLGWTEWGVSGYPARSPISLSYFSSPSASRFRCFGAPINPLLSGETPKLKKIYICVDMYEGGSLSLSLLFLSLCSSRERERETNRTRGEARDSGRPFRGDPFF